MKLTFVIGSLEMGGAQRVALNLIKEWRARNWAVRLVVTYSGRGTCYYEVPDGVEVIYLADLVRPHRGWRVVEQLRRAMALRRLLIRERPDHVISFLTDANILAIVASLGLGLRVIVSERSYPPADKGPWLYAKARLFTYPFASRVVMQTGRGLEWLSQSIPHARGVVIPNPVALPLPRTIPALAPDDFVDREAHLLLGVGRLVHQKGFDVLIEAFRQVAEAHDDWRLVIVGSGEDHDKLDLQVEQAGLAGRVCILGAAGNIGDWYLRADIFAMTSRLEGFPNALLEAMAHGCAAISFDCDTGPADMIDSGQNGLLLGATPNATELAGALSALMADADRRRELGSAARSVLVRFSMEAVLACWDAALGIDRAEGDRACAV